MPKEDFEAILKQSLGQLTEVMDLRFRRLEEQREHDAQVQSKNHGENVQAINSQTSSMSVLQRQMSSLIGEGLIDGRIGTMSREIGAVKEDVEEMKRTMLKLLAGFVLNIVATVVTVLLYLGTRK